jgi:hypothetical protein
MSFWTSDPRQPTADAIESLSCVASRGAEIGALGHKRAHLIYGRLLGRLIMKWWPDKLPEPTALLSAPPDPIPLTSIPLILSVSGSW